MYYIQSNIEYGLETKYMNILELLKENSTIKEYNTFIIRYVIEDLKNRLGDTTIHAINLYLRRYKLSINDIVNEPEEVRRAFYNMFGNGAYRLEQEIIKSMYELLELDVTPMNSMTHSIKLAKNYFKIYNNYHNSIEDILELINIEHEPKYCKVCDNRLDPRKCTYDGLLTELCEDCYNMQNDMVISVMNETLE